jgi:hypothetical protein
VALSCLICRLGPAYIPFIIPARRKTQTFITKDLAKSPQFELYESLIAKVLKERQLPIEPEQKFLSQVSNKNTERLQQRMINANYVPTSYQVYQSICLFIYLIID